LARVIFIFALIIQWFLVGFFLSILMSRLFGRVNKKCENSFRPPPPKKIHVPKPINPIELVAVVANLAATH